MKEDELLKLSQTEILLLKRLINKYTKITKVSDWLYNVELNDLHDAFSTKDYVNSTWE